MPRDVLTSEHIDRFRAEGVTNEAHHSDGCSCGHDETSHDSSTLPSLSPPLSPTLTQLVLELSPETVARVEAAMEEAEEESEDICLRCSNHQDECECYRCDGCNTMVSRSEPCEDCVQCEVCECWNDRCECVLCETCNNNFNSDGCSNCRACQRCIERGRVDHWRCTECEVCCTGADRHCSACGASECCASFSCNICNECERCCSCDEPSNDEGYIQGYSYRRYPAFKPPKSTVPESYLYLGVELETESPDEDETMRASAAKTIATSEFASRLLIKEDGSLDCGLEFVSGPMGLSEHRDLWPKLCAAITATGLRSWTHRTTGMHVHLSRSFFTALAIEKFVCFINSDDDAIATGVRKLAGRSGSSYARISKKKLGDCRWHYPEGRYEAVNLTNDDTIEVRIFKGTLKASHVLANIQFCHALACYVSQVGIQDFESWASFTRYVLQSPKAYRHLLEFLGLRKDHTSPKENAYVSSHC